MVDQQRYLEHVYAGVLGKIIGVYMGRPFEGWPKERLEERFGAVDRYVADEMGKPLIVSDDDITGTFTFVRALEDSGLFADTPCDFFGDTWLNYLVERKTVLWWGGLGHSTEHTAYLRLKDGIRAPESGSIARNGQVVAEQIGAQIFIDGIGLVCPGRPEQAAELAARAARVSHDGEAVYAAQVVAAMVAAAFEHSDLHALMDIGVAQIPAECLIAQLHRDVRAWAAEDGDWRATFGRIAETYGYRRYGGNCHVIPNHALMVLAWAYAPDDFHLAQVIVNTAGWDTDCNAANVGSVMGVALGRAAIDARYDYTGPVADRLVLPTADGSRSISDALTEARHLAAMGRRIMGWAPAAAPTAWQDFALPGAVQGWRPLGADGARCINVAHDDASAGRCLRIASPAGAESPRRAGTPVFHPAFGGYGFVGCPRLAPGMTARLRVLAVEGAPALRLGLRAGEDAWRFGQAQRLPASGGELELVVPNDTDGPVLDLVLELDGAGAVLVDAVDYGGRVAIDLPLAFAAGGAGGPGAEWEGWIVDADIRRRGSFSDDDEPQCKLIRDRGRGLLTTGGRDWTDQRVAARMGIHLASECGLVVRRQGQERWIGLLRTPTGFRLIRRWYGEDQVLAEREAPAWVCDELHALELAATGSRIVARCDGEELFAVDEERLARGGAGVLLADGLIGLRDLALEAAVVPAWSQQATPA